MDKNLLVEKWEPLINAEGLPQMPTKTEAIAAIFENQEKDFANDPAYQDPMVIQQFKTISEAVVTGDAGYNADNIAAGKNSGAAVNVGPQIMGLVRRAIPKMIAFDIAGVQPLSQSTGQVFTFRKIYGGNPLDKNAFEAQHPTNAPQTSFSGNFKAIKDFDAVAYTVGDLVKVEFKNAQTGDELRFFQVTEAVTPAAKTEDEAKKLISEGKFVEIGEGMATSLAELQEGFNGSTNNPWNEMSLRIDKQTVEAKSRQLKAQYSIELAQDLKAVHGLDADTELQNILAEEIMLEIDREVIQWINATAQVGKTGFTRTEGTDAGVFDFTNAKDVKSARWAGESFKALMFQIDKEANEIARQTGRGAGNIIIASRNVVQALASTDVFIGWGVQGTQTGLNTDTNKSMFAGVLAGKYKVYIDHYARTDYVTVGYKGSSAMDTGLVYCPYVPLTPLRATDPKNFQPVIGFKTRYAIAVNPLADPAINKVSSMAQVSSAMPTTASFGRNCYYRRFLIKGL